MLINRRHTVFFILLNLRPLKISKELNLFLLLWPNTEALSIYPSNIKCVHVTRLSTQDYLFYFINSTPTELNLTRLEMNDWVFLLYLYIWKNWIYFSFSFVKKKELNLDFILVNWKPWKKNLKMQRAPDERKKTRNFTSSPGYSHSRTRLQHS